MPIDTSLFLIGYRGTGKTSVAQHLADLKGHANWVDSDDLIEQRAGKTIAQMFADQGEPAFRDLESEVIEKLCQGTPQVIALGGGAVLRAETRERIAAAGKVIWLTATPATLAERLLADTSSAERRPSLTEAGLIGEIEQVLAERAPIYQECATFEVDTEGRSPLEVAKEIQQRLENIG